MSDIDKTIVYLQSTFLSILDISRSRVRSSDKKLLLIEAYLNQEMKKLMIISKKERDEEEAH